MGESFAASVAELDALGRAWERVADALSVVTGADAVRRCPPSLAGSHTAWVCSQVAPHMADELAAAVQRVAGLSGAASHAGAAYDAQDGAQAALYTSTTAKGR